MDCANRLTVTHDEYWHLPVGLLNLKTGRFDYDNLNPPLVRMWAALPLLLTARVPDPIDTGLDATGHGDAFLAANGENYHELFAHGRWMIVVLSVATGVVLAVWAHELFGNAAAILTALFWSACPTVLMNAALVTTDLGAAFFFAATLYTVWKHARRPSWKAALCIGLLLGMAQLAKYTSIVLFPLAALVWLLLRFGNNKVEARSLWQLVGHWVSAMLISVVVWNAGYLFQGSFTRFGDYQFDSKSLAKLSKHSLLSRLPVPLPDDYVKGLDRQRHIMESKHPVYLDGRWSTTGFSDYYLKALWYKVPHALQLLAMASLLFVLMPGREPRQLRVQLSLLVPAVGLVAIAGQSSMQLGIRYLLPMFPLLILFAGQAGRWLRWRRYPVRAALIVLLAIAASFSVRHHPHHLAYFNELAGGPALGHTHLLDSNLDWGQDLRALKQYLDAQEITDVGLAYFGTVPPASLGIRYHVAPSRIPKPGWHAVSVNFVQGRPHWLREPDGTIRPVDFDEFGYFRAFEPVARIGYSIWVYHIPEYSDRR
ncbi:MAG: glycosyltransferase family 39 protein [Planctomycetaceae bacterium]